MFHSQPCMSLLTFLSKFMMCPRSGSHQSMWNPQSYLQSICRKLYNTSLIPKHSISFHNMLLLHSSCHSLHTCIYLNPLQSRKQVQRSSKLSCPHLRSSIYICTHDSFHRRLTESLCHQCILHTRSCFRSRSSDMGHYRSRHYCQL